MATSILRRVSAFRAEVAVGEITAVFSTQKPLGEKIVRSDLTLESKTSSNPDDTEDGVVALTGRTYTQLKSRALNAILRARGVEEAAQCFVITEAMREEAAKLAEQENIPDSDK